jgi:hypothetical protein
MMALLDKSKNLVMIDGKLTIHVFSTLVVGVGKYWAQELSTGLSDYDFGTNWFSSFTGVN